MKTILRAVAVLTVVVIALFVAARAFAFHEVQVSGYHTPPAGAATPATQKLRYEDVRIPSGDRTLRAWLVPSGDPGAPAVLIYHGDGETLSYWLGALALLHRQGVTAMIFDYSGYGASSGRPSYANLDADAIAAYKTFIARTPHAKRRIALGLSLGNGVLLDGYAAAHPAIDGIVLTGAWSTVRNVVGRTGRFPSSLTFLLPDVYDNVEQARKVDVPLLVVEGGDDRVAPLAEASQVEEGATGPKALVVRPGYDHNAPWQNPDMGFWAPIVSFIKTGAGVEAQ